MPSTISKNALWAGRITSGFAALFLLADGIMKIFKPAFVIEATVKLGYLESVIFPLGIVLTLCTWMYVVPRTSILGAILLTGYLGGAVATNVRVSGAAFEIVFPAVIGVLVWGGLWLRDERLRKLLPLNKS